MLTSDTKSAHEIIESAAAALLFAATFLAGVHPLRAVVRDQRAVDSFAAGMSAAYAFVHVMPQLDEARHALHAAAGMRFKGMVIYAVALLGFLISYGLNHLRAPSSASAERSLLSLRLHVGGFAAYVFMVSYLLMRELGESPASTALYAMAIAAHFLTVDHALASEHGRRYEKRGRFLLAGMALLGWGAGLLFVLPPVGVALTIGLLAGAIIMNSMIMEMPSEKNGRFRPFVLGGLVYAALLLSFV